MARQDPSYKGLGAGRDAKRQTLLKLAQLRCTGHVTRMPDERLPKKFSMETFRKKCAKNATKTLADEFHYSN